MASNSRIGRLFGLTEPLCEADQSNELVNERMLAALGRHPRDMRITVRIVPMVHDRTVLICRTELAERGADDHAQSAHAPCPSISSGKPRLPLVVLPRLVCSVAHSGPCRYVTRALTTVQTPSDVSHSLSLQRTDSHGEHFQPEGSEASDYEVVTSTARWPCFENDGSS